MSKLLKLIITLGTLSLTTACKFNGTNTGNPSSLPDFSSPYIGITEPGPAPIQEIDSQTPDSPVEEVHLMPAEPSTWGEKIGIRSADIPLGQFRAYFFKRDGGNGAPGTMLRESTVLDQPFFNYLGAGGYYASAEQQYGAYFIGQFEFAPSAHAVTFDFSNPQWDTVRLYIDGQLAHTYGRNASGGPDYQRQFYEGGTHTFAIEYEGHWHAGTFAARVGRIPFPADTYWEKGDIPNILNDLKRKIGSFKVAAAATYESSDGDHGKIDLNFTNLSEPTVLVLASYDPIRWQLNTPPENLAQIKAIVVYSLAGAATPDVADGIPVFLVRNVYIGDGNGRTTAEQVSAVIKQPVNSFAQAYSTTSFNLSTP